MGEVETNALGTTEKTAMIGQPPGSLKQASNELAFITDHDDFQQSLTKFLDKPTSKKVLMQEQPIPEDDGTLILKVPEKKVQA